MHCADEPAAQGSGPLPCGEGARIFPRDKYVPFLQGVATTCRQYKQMPDFVPCIRQ